MNGTLAAISNSDHEKKAMFRTLLFIFKFNEKHYTLKDTAGQSWQTTYGQKAQASPTNQSLHLFH